MLKEILLSAAEDDVYQGDLLELVAWLCNKFPEARESVLQLVGVIFAELRESMGLKQIIFDPQF